MLTIRHFPHLLTPEITTWLSSKTNYDRDGRFTALLSDALDKCPPQLLPLRDALSAALDHQFPEIIFQAYQHGKAAVHCHTDGKVGFQIILSIGATRTFRFHRVEEGGCDSPKEAIFVECEHGAALLMEPHLQENWHHRVMPDPGITGERFGLVFREAGKSR